MFLNQIPVVKAEMLIRRPVAEVFEAFVDPQITTKFWFTKSSGRLEAGKNVRWEWEMYGVADELYVKEIEPDKRISVQSSDGSTIDWVFTARADNETFVTITSAGFVGNGDEIVSQAIDSMGGYTIVLCGLKMYLEHGVTPQFVEDKSPDAHVR